MEKGNRPRSKFNEESQPYYQLEYERDRLQQTLDFAGDKCNRQGAFLASLCDYIETHIDNPPENFLYDIHAELVHFLNSEVDIMAKWVKKRNKDGNHD